MKTTIEHYNFIAKNFNEYWHFSDMFVDTLADDISNELSFKKHDVFVDIGCGTGLYTCKVAFKKDLRLKVTCVDNAKEMLQQIPGYFNVVKVHLDALSFSKKRLHYDKVLLKEVIHHMKNYEEVLTNLSSNLNDNGSILILISPVHVNYPLFSKALDLRQKGQPLEHKIRIILDSCGLKTSINSISYLVVLKKVKYLTMVKNKYMSFLSLFTKQELKEGIREMKTKLASKKAISFTETYFFIKGTKAK